MCLLVASFTGNVITKKQFRIARLANPDGLGYAYALNGQVHWLKTIDKTASTRSLYRDYVQACQGSAHILHFRWASFGDVTLDNVHPFELPDGRVMAHNGTFTDLNPPCGYSDTRFLAEYLLPFIDLENVKMYSQFENYCRRQGSKVAIIDGNGYIDLYNIDAGHFSSDGAIWYSNNSYEPDRWMYDTCYGANFGLGAIK
jgi:predicted glutamine amidotransferase